MKNTCMFCTLLIISQYFAAKVEPNCAKSKDCTCIAFKSGEYEYHCPPNNSQNVFIHVVPKKSVTIDCNNLNPDFINLQLKSPNIQLISMTSCSFPLNGFQNIFDQFNLEPPKFFKFQYTTGNLSSSRNYFNNKSFNIVESLSLSSNNLVYLDKSFFWNLTNLLYLDLKNNNLQLVNDLFQNTKKLRIIDLSRNNLDKLPQNLFHNLFQLEELILWHNDLKTLNNNFRDLINLNSLELGYNKLEEIGENIFGNLTNLTNINLFSNKLSNTGRNLFKNNLFLERIRLGNNPKLSLSDELFGDLPRLRDVSLVNSNLKFLPSRLFNNSQSLEIINLEQNEIEELPELIFNDLNNLKELNLRSNKIKKLPNNIFSSLENLKILHLNYNYLTEISEFVFSNLHNLEELNLEMNNIRFIHLESFSYNKNLMKINLAYNKYSYNDYENEQTDKTPFYNCDALEELNLSNNLIESLMEDDLIYTKFYLRNLDLSYNKIKNIEINPFGKVSQYHLNLNLSNNSITEIYFYTIDIIEQNRDILEDFTNFGFAIDLSSNYITCDCFANDFIKYLQNQFDLNIQKLVEIKSDDLKCAGPGSLTNLNIKDIFPSMLICPLEEVVEDFEKCPNNCTCRWRPFDSAIVIDCSNNNLTAIPEIYLPSNLKFNQTELHLESNAIAIGPIKNSLENVTKLFLSDNLIQNLTWIPPNIQILTLHNNLLDKLNYEVIIMLNNSNFTQITLSNNPWICDCSATNFSNFLKHHKQIESEDIRCQENNKPLISLHKNDLCRSQTILILFILSSLSCITLIPTIMLALYFRYKEEIRSWLYNKNIFLRFVTEIISDENKCFDAFFSYSMKDEIFVAEEILPILEDGTYPYQFCLPYRHWLPCATIQGLISKSVRESRRIVVILSQNFLDDVWRKKEFRAAHTQTINNKRVRFIFVLCDGVDLDNLDAELRELIKNNKCMKWGEPWFWRKFIYALPHYKKL